THGTRLASSGSDPVKGLAQAERGCVLDDSECGWAARMYARGVGTAVNQTKASMLFNKACERGSLDSCIDLGVRQRDGVGGASNRTAALGAFDRACTGGNASGCTQAAQLLAADDATSAKAFRYADMGCDRDDGQACMEASRLAQRGRHGKAADLERAFRLAERGCKQGNPAACAAVAEAHEAGSGTSKDADKAVSYFQKACDGNATQLKTSACVALARILSAGDGVTKDPAAALTAAIRACNYKEEAACEMIGPLADVAKPDDAGKSAALAALSVACDGKIESACLFKGYALATGGALGEKAPKQAYELFAASCARKSDAGCNQQANALAGGFGVVMNREQAQVIWKDLCDRQYASACTSLAKLYRLDKRDSDAVPLWLQACDQKIGEACNSAALAHYSQRGTTWDVIAAGKLYQRACDYGFALGCTNFGELFEYGVGVPADAKQAALYYDKGCTDTVPEGCGRIARMLVAGNGIGKDLMRAEAMFRRGCTAGEPESCRELADLLESAPMPPRAEIARLRAAAYQGVTTQAQDNPYYVWVLGKFVRDGVGTVKDPKAATDWFAKACDGYDPMGCLAAGTAFAARDGADNRDRAKLYFERACGAGVEAGCQRLAGKHPGQVSSKGCGGCSTGGGNAAALPLLLATLGVFGWLHRRRDAATRREPQP
nr:sel1 repeat family protein [Kofleriaceae bacterium]